MPNRPLIVGVTGMIGSGKTTVCKRFNDEFGFKVFYSDVEAKKLYLDEDVQKEVLEVTGTLDKKEIANIIFKDYKKLDRINKIFHPRVADVFNKFCIDNKDEIVILYESALLLGNKKEVDKIIVVDCDTATKVSRTISRDSISQEKVLDRLFAQMDMFCDNLNVKKIDYTILTDNDYSLILKIVGNDLIRLQKCLG